MHGTSPGLTGVCWHPFPPSLSEAPGQREAGGTGDMMYKSHVILLWQHLEYPRRGQCIIVVATLKNIKILKWMARRKRYYHHLTKRKNSDDRFGDDHTEASGRATRRARAIWVICLRSRMRLLLLIQLQVTLPVH